MSRPCTGWRWRGSLASPREFGDVGPKLLSDYIASDVGAELREWVFSPVLFNSIDWTETALFKRPPSQLADYLNDDRVFGIHLWNWKTESLSLECGLLAPQPAVRPSRH